MLSHLARLGRRQSRTPIRAGWIVFLVCFGFVSTALAYTDEQAKQGAQVFASYCSTCHGDRGQGLTDEFRATWPPEDQNCWKSKCHAVNHPPGGFVLPQHVPAITGPDTLANYKTAQSLHDFIIKNMPYQQPGMLNEEQYWQVTAFLIRQRGTPSDDVPLDAANAANIQIGLNAASPSQGVPFKPPTMPPQKRTPNMRWVWLLVTAMLVGGGLAVVFFYLVHTRRIRRPNR